MTLRNQEQALTMLARDLWVGNTGLATIRPFCRDGVFAVAVWAFDKPGSHARRDGSSSHEPCRMRDCGNTSRHWKDISNSETTRGHYQTGLFSRHNSIRPCGIVP